MMLANGTVSLQGAHGPTLLDLPAKTLRSRSVLHLPTIHGGGFRLGGFLTILGTCLAVGLVAFIALEAFDSDQDLWPFMSGELIGPLHGKAMTGGLGAGAFAVLSAIQCFVITAGVRLVLRHRARGAIATDHPSRSMSILLNVAEPRWSNSAILRGSAISFRGVARPSSGGP